MRSYVVAAFVLAAGFGPVAAHAEWQTDARSGCTVWDPLPVANETVDWSGNCQAGKASGPGIVTISRAGKVVERNQGTFVDGKQTGPGVRENPTGRYVGEFRDGLFDGKGLFVASTDNGMRYDGDWKNGNLDGTGKLSFASGVRYEGQFRANTYTGFGSLSLPDGSRYEGEYALNTPNGEGTYIRANGATYAGHWSHGCFKQGASEAYLGVPPEDCGLSEDSEP